MTLETEEGTATMTGDGVFDLSSGRGTMSMQYGLGFGELTGATFESVSDGAVIYLKMPVSILPSSKPWVKIDLQQAGQEAGIDLQTLQQAGSNDPTQFLQFLRGVSKDVKTVGKDDVRGEATTHYKATVDLQKAAQSLGPEAGRSIDNLIEQLGTSKVPAEYWIDGEGRLRRMAMTLDSDGKDGPMPPTDMTYELYDFGAPVDVTIPPANQVMTLDELRRGGR
jgi:hypothetical protein